jgi:hypothetical protein
LGEAQTSSGHAESVYEDQRSRCSVLDKHLRDAKDALVSAYHAAENAKSVYEDANREFVAKEKLARVVMAAQVPTDMLPGGGSKALAEAKTSQQSMLIAKDDLTDKQTAEVARKKDADAAYKAVKSCKDVETVAQQNLQKANIRVQQMQELVRVAERGIQSAKITESCADKVDDTVKVLRDSGTKIEEMPAKLYDYCFTLVEQQMWAVEGLESSSAMSKGGIVPNLDSICAKVRGDLQLTADAKVYPGRPESLKFCYSLQHLRWPSKHRAGAIAKAVREEKAPVEQRNCSAVREQARLADLQYREAMRLTNFDLWFRGDFSPKRSAPKEVGASAKDISVAREMQEKYYRALHKYEVARRTLRAFDREQKILGDSRAKLAAARGAHQRAKEALEAAERAADIGVPMKVSKVHKKKAVAPLEKSTKDWNVETNFSEPINATAEKTNATVFSSEESMAETENVTAPATQPEANETETSPKAVTGASAGAKSKKQLRKALRKAKAAKDEKEAAEEAAEDEAKEKKREARHAQLEKEFDGQVGTGSSGATGSASGAMESGASGPSATGGSNRKRLRSALREQRIKKEEAEIEKEEAEEAIENAKKEAAKEQEEKAFQQKISGLSTGVTGTTAATGTDDDVQPTTGASGATGPTSSAETESSQQMILNNNVSSVKEPRGLGFTHAVSASSGASGASGASGPGYSDYAKVNMTGGDAFPKGTEDTRLDTSFLELYHNMMDTPAEGEMKLKTSAEVWFVGDEGKKKPASVTDAHKIFEDAEKQANQWFAENKDASAAAKSMVNKKAMEEKERALQIEEEAMEKEKSAQVAEEDEEAIAKQSVTGGRAGVDTRLSKFAYAQRRAELASAELRARSHLYKALQNKFDAEKHRYTTVSSNLEENRHKVTVAKVNYQTMRDELRRCEMSMPDLPAPFTVSRNYAQEDSELKKDDPSAFEDAENKLQLQREAVNVEHGNFTKELEQEELKEAVTEAKKEVLKASGQQTAAQVTNDPNPASDKLQGDANKCKQACPPGDQTCIAQCLAAEMDVNDEETVAGPSLDGEEFLSDA